MSKNFLINYIFIYVSINRYYDCIQLGTLIFNIYTFLSGLGYI